MKHKEVSLGLTLSLVLLVSFVFLFTVTARGTEDPVTPLGSKGKTRMVPLRIIQPLACAPGSTGCSPNLDYEKLRAAVDRANTIYAAAGLKLWLKSVEYYYIPKIYLGNHTEYTWGDFKNYSGLENNILDIFPNMPADAYHDTLDKKLMGQWLSNATAMYGDPDEFLVWLLWGSEGSNGQSPKHGRTAFINAKECYDSGDPFQPEGWARSYFAHELGHFFGPIHVWNFDTNLNPKTNSPFTPADQWDTLHCENPLHFYSSRQDFVNNPCQDPKLTYDNLIDYLGGPFDPLYAEILGVIYFAGDTVMNGLVRLTGESNNPPNSFSWEFNVMGYYGREGHFSKDHRIPAFFNQTQLEKINLFMKYDVAYLDEYKALMLTYDGNLPKGTTEEYLTSLRTKLGTSHEDFIWWSNGDWTFARETVPIKGTKYQPVGGDFDGDGYDDIIWYNATEGTASIWWGNGNRTFTHTSLSDLPKGCTIFAGNFDGKYGTDFYLYKSGKNTDTIYWSNGLDRTFDAQAVEVTGTYKPFAADFDGDGNTDIFWYVPSSGKLNIWWSNGDRTFTKVNNYSTGLKNYTPLVGNFDGKDGDDIFWYRPGGGSGKSEYIYWSINGSRLLLKVAAQHVTGTYNAFSGDFNGDGIDDIFWDAQGAINDHIWAGSASGNFQNVNQSVYGTFTPVAGDFDGDGKTDIFWYRGPN